MKSEAMFNSTERGLKMLRRGKVRDVYEPSAEHLLKVGERVYNLERYYNNLNGFGEGSDTLPDRFTKEASTMPGSMGHVCELDDMLAEYYEKRGWVNGVVPEAKLKELAIL